MTRPKGTVYEPVGFGWRVADGSRRRKTGRWTGCRTNPELARRQLGVLSGDTVVIEGEQATVAKMWPADPSVPENVIQIDGDTRANAEAHVGDTVTVRTKDTSTIAEAEQVTLVPPASFTDSQQGVSERTAAKTLRNRPVRAAANRFGSRGSTRTRSKSPIPTLMGTFGLRVQPRFESLELARRPNGGFLECQPRSEADARRQIQFGRFVVRRRRNDALPWCHV